MASNVNPTVRRRRLGQELRRLRELKGMTAEDVAERLLVSQSKISRLENGRRSISQRDVRDLCGVYEVEDQHMVESLMQMAKESRQQGWWHAFGSLSPSYSVYIGLESDALSVRNYESLLVPGLLQTPEYAEAVIRGMWPEATPEDVESRVGVRLKRQQRLHVGERPLRFWAVIDESATRRIVGDRQTMREQLEHLVELSQLPHVTLQVVPYSVGSHPGMTGTFSILEFDDPSDSTTVYLEGVTSDLYLEKHGDVHKYGIMYEHLRAQALNADETRKFISDVAKEYAA